MTLKPLIFASIIATIGLVASHTSMQAAGFTAMKSALPLTAAQSHAPNVIFVHEPSYAEYLAAHRRGHLRRRNFSAEQYSRYSPPSAYHKLKKSHRTCVIRRDFPNWTETGLNMPPWEWVPC